MLRKTLRVFRRHFAIRRGTAVEVESAKNLSATLAVTLSQLQKRGFETEVFEALGVGVRDIAVSLGQFMTLQSKSTNANKTRQAARRKTQNSLHDNTVSWGTLLTISMAISLMLLEKEAPVANASLSSLRMSEPLCSVLFGLLRVNATQATYLPFQAKVIGLCLSLSKATERYCPLPTALADFADNMLKCMRGSARARAQLEAKQNRILKPAALGDNLVLVEEQLTHPTFHENLLTALLISGLLKKHALEKCVNELVRELAAPVQQTSEHIKKIRPALAKQAFRRGLGDSNSINIIPAETYAAFDLVKMAAQRSVNKSIFIF